MGCGGGTLKEISMDSQPHAHHGRGNLSEDLERLPQKDYDPAKLRRTDQKTAAE
jgi:hypothetical protein